MWYERNTPLIPPDLSAFQGFSLPLDGPNVDADYAAQTTQYVLVG
jgi:hypothetical protein